ncbi:hypothetical protein BYT27DRAFT_7253536 [Phlegmacium glaucopus]|nr:hypothetical protein BYT27DRAFT_7253536 [Phlegmacium glaucopus]
MVILAIIIDDNTTLIILTPFSHSPIVFSHTPHHHLPFPLSTFHHPSNQIIDSHHHLQLLLISLSSSPTPFGLGLGSGSIGMVNMKIGKVTNMTQADLRQVVLKVGDSFGWDEVVG